MKLTIGLLVLCDGLVVHYRQKFGLESTVLPALTPGTSEVNPNRQQLIAENVMESMHKTYSRFVENNSSILIGITSDDMYPLGQNWQFCFGWRKPEIRSAVVSTARMNLHYEGEPASQANETSRLQKIVTKDIGIMYYNKSTSDNPHSVLFSGILGIQELDQPKFELDYLSDHLFGQSRIRLGTPSDGLRRGAGDSS